MEDIGISVLIPLYNGIEFLEISLNSVIRQTYTKWEVIVGINGYKKDSIVEHLAKEIIEKLNNKNIILKYYETDGKANTLNKMIEDIKYDYVALLDVDDIWLDNKLEEQIKYIKEGYDVIGTGCKYIGDLNFIPDIPYGDISDYDIFKSNPIINSSVIIRKSDGLWEDTKYNIGNYNLEDYSLWFKLYYEKRRIYNIQKILVYHRIHINSAFNSKGNSNGVEKLREEWRKVYDTR